MITDNDPFVEEDELSQNDSVLGNSFSLENSQAQNSAGSNHIKLFRGLSQAANQENPPDALKRNLNTFSGVFTPVCLSMFSSILFLRMGYVLGNCGLIYAIIQLLLAYLIVILTVLSVCAISTNGAIEGGGVYFMISRALGPEFGGSIGIIFYMANVLSSALYLTGCVEGLLDSFGPTGSLYPGLLSTDKWFCFGYASSLNAFNVLICVAGSSLFAKTTAAVFCAVFGAIMLVIVSLLTDGASQIEVPAENAALIAQNITQLNFTGISYETFTNNIMPTFGTDYSTSTMTTFASVFGVLFTGVTGVLAGANMSGELRKPAKSIPKGTLSALAATFFTYILVFVVTAATCPGHLLRNNYSYMQQLVVWPTAVAIGVLSATLSAALSNLIGASRVAAALGADNLFGVLTRPLRPTRGKQPIGSVLLTGAGVQALLFVGRLNPLAQATSVCFMLAYAAINLACLALTLTSAPNFRPSFRLFHWTTCTGGLIASLLLMFTTSALYASGALLICVLLVIVLHIQAPAVSWGSISQALIFHQVRKYLLLLDPRKAHVKYWRPQLLLLVSSARSSVPLIELANDLKKSGLYVLGHVRVLNSNEQKSREKQSQIQSEMTFEQPFWLKLVDCLKVKAFVELTAADSFYSGAIQLARLSGLGALKPNTVLLGFRDKHESLDFFGTDRRFSSLKTISISGRQFSPLGHKKPSSVPSTTDFEYVCLIADLLFSLSKNVCLARNFERLNRTRIFESRQLFIDVWPCDPFSSANQIPSIDNCWLFLMQLACILRMVPGWKQACRLRVMMFQRHSEPLKAQWEQMLKLLRIHATIVTVAEVQETSPLLNNESSHSTLTSFVSPPSSSPTLDDFNSVQSKFNVQSIATSANLTESSLSNYQESQSNVDTNDGSLQVQVEDQDCESNFEEELKLNRCKFVLPSERQMKHLNETMKKHSADSVLLFTYLPLPPFNSNQSQAELYLKRLDQLTENLPPTLMVHGISPVTSTTL